MTRKTAVAFLAAGMTAAAACGITRLTAPAFAADAADKTAAAEAPANTLTDAEKQAGWALLFDGKTTAGWRGFKKDKAPDGWKVIDGELTRADKGGDIMTIDQFDSFELVLDFKISKAGNSGLMYHVSEEGGAPYHTGPEFQLQDDANAKDPQLTGWCYQLYKPAIDPKTGKPLCTTKPAGEWNTVRLLIDGPHVEHWVNGAKYVEYELGSDDWNQKVAQSKFKAFKSFGAMKKGHIDLQDHGNPVAFRNVKIRPIKKG